MRQLDVANCMSGNTSDMADVREVWRDRESLPADAAARDPIVQAFMATCLVEASLGAKEPADPSAVAYLRKSLTSRTPAVAGSAMVGLAPLLTKEDIPTIVRAASTDSALEMPAIAALSTSCIPEAKAGIASIRAAAIGSPQAKDIDQFIADLEGHCNGKGPLSGERFDAQVALAPDTSLPVRKPNAAQVRAALDSPDAKTVLQILLDVPCTQQPSDAVDEMRRAWHERNSPGASRTMKDPVAQAVIASCVIAAADPSDAMTSDRVEAATLLRTSIRGDDVMAIMSAIRGLAIVNATKDIRSIADVPKRMPSLLNSVIRFVGFTCGANNVKTLALIRKELTTEKLRDQFDAVYKDVEEVRKQQGCADGKRRG